MNPNTKTISDAAKQFIKNAEPLKAWNLDTIDLLRAEEEEAAIQSNKAIISTYVGQLTKSEIGGIPALIVTPKHYDPVNSNYRILYFFGGAFVMGSPDVDLLIIARLAAKLGIKVVAPYCRHPRSRRIHERDC